MMGDSQNAENNRKNSIKKPSSKRELHMWESRCSSANTHIYSGPVWPEVVEAPVTQGIRDCNLWSPPKACSQFHTYLNANSRRIAIANSLKMFA